MVSINSFFEHNKSRKNIGRILALSMLVVMYSCGGSGADKKDTDIAAEDTMTVGMDYLLPTPEELISQLADNNFVFNDKSLLDLKRIDKITLTRYKALYFGITYSDFLYLSYFNKGYKALDYLNALKKLSTSLGITNKLNDEYLTRMEKNLTNVDSLKIISIELSIEVFKNIETLGGKELYAQIGIGTIIEALYLATQSIDKVEGNEQLIARVVEMGLFFDNYMENYAQYRPKDTAGAQLLNDLNTIKDGFFALNEDTKELVVEKKTIKDSVAHLTFSKSESNKTKLNNEKFFGLKRQIEHVRTNIFEQKY